MNSPKKKSVTNIRVNKAKSVDDEQVIRALEQAAAEHDAQGLRNSVDLIRKNVEILARSPKFQNGWKLYQLTDKATEDDLANTLEKPIPNNYAQGNPFDVPYTLNNIRLRSPDSLHTRQHSPPQKSPKKDCDDKKMTDKALDPMSIESALKRLQEEVLQSEREGKEPDWIKSLKPDPFSVMNMIRMKSLINKKESVEKKERLKRKIFSSRSSLDGRNSVCSVDDDTDAPSIVSMEEDFQLLPEPLKLSDIQVPAATSSAARSRSSTLSSESKFENWKKRWERSERDQREKGMKEEPIKSFFSPVPSLPPPGENFENWEKRCGRRERQKKEQSQKEESIKSLMSEALPLDVPNLTLEAGKTPSDLSSSLSLQIPSQSLKSSYIISSVDSRKKLISPFVSSAVEEKPKLNKKHGRKSSSRERQEKTSQQDSSLESGQIEIGQVAASVGSVSELRSVRTVPASPAPSVPRDQERSVSLNPATEEPSLLSSVLELTPSQGSLDLPRCDFSPASSHWSLKAPEIPASFKRTSRNVEVLQVLIDDAKFNRKQYQLFYKTQENIIFGNYQNALTDNFIRFRRAEGLTDDQIKVKEKKAKEKLKANFEIAKANLRKIRDKVISNYNRRIEDLIAQQNLIKKHIIYHTTQSRSTDASPKKVTTHRSTSATSVVESSSSESNIGLQSNRKEAGNEDRQKVEMEISRRLKEEVQKFEEKEQPERLIKLGRRDKSTSPLEGLLKTPTRDVACSVKDEILSQLSQQSHQASSLQSVEEVVRGSDVYNSESFESPESSETPRQPRLSGFNRPTLASKPFIASRSKVQIKVPLSPRLAPRMRQRVRCSSGSDESLILSHNETQSEQSDYEVKISALKEQKRQRYAEAKRLQRELKRVQKEQLKATEDSLKKQIEVYEQYIQQTKQELENIKSTTIVRPQIKVPRLSDRFSPRTSDVSRRSSVVEDSLLLQEPPGSDAEANSLKSVSEEASSIETTIQSKGKIQAAESSPEINEEIDRKVDSEPSEIPSSAVTETSLASESLKSLSTEESEKLKSVPEIKSPSPDDGDIKDESQWIDAEKFFDELSVPDISFTATTTRGKRLGDDILGCKSDQVVSSESGTSETKISEKISEANSTEENKGNLRSNFLHPLKTESIDKNETSNLSREDKSKEDSLLPSNDEHLVSDNLDVGSIVSIVSQAPSKSQKSTNSIPSIQELESPDVLVKKSRSDSDFKSTTSVPEEMFESSDGDVKSDAEASENEPERNESIESSTKSTVSEATFLNHSESNESSESSKENLNLHSSQEEDKTSEVSNQLSEVSENLEKSGKEVIQVFLSDKKDLSSEAEESANHSGHKLNHTYALPSESINESELVLDKTFIVPNESLNESGDKIAKSVAATNNFERMENQKSEIEVSDRASDVEKITDHIMSQLLTDCLNHAPKNKEIKGEVYQYDEYDLTIKKDHSKHEAFADDFARRVLKSFVHDAASCILKIHDSKKRSADVNDILKDAEDVGLRVDSLSNKLLDALALESTTPTNKGKEEVSPKSISQGLNLSSEVELSDGGEGEVFWFDEDLRPASLQAQREAEELRIKQLQIEQEIKQLEQAQESIPSYYYVREIPNKPPPPYTPPGQSGRPGGAESPAMGRPEVERLVAAATKDLYVIWCRCGNLSAAQASEEFTAKPSANKKFLFDLVKQIFVEITSTDGEEKDVPPWEKVARRTRRLVPPRTEESLRAVVLKKVRVLFGFEPNTIKENLIIQWSRKKRDRVDELLVQESQEEEREWTDYGRCEVAVKNNVAMGLFDNLVNETAQVFYSAYQKKLNYSVTTS